MDGNAADLAVMAAFFNFVLLIGIDAPSGHAMPRTQNSGQALAHTLLRRWMRLMAQHVKVEPLCISFHTAKHAIVAALNTVYLARAGALPQHLQRLLEQARYFVLPVRRSGRSFPREVKRSRSKFPTKKMRVSS
ncbi:hypothetical protein GCM10010975_36420 [Comamonas phosphati]|nr:hypothetical protein GCM10010975_36420 [Comamonas phosphati]